MFKNILRALERIERRQRLILEELRQLRAEGERAVGDAGHYGADGRERQWLESGIDNILAYQVGKKRGEQ